ncbi:GNAT family N-acetyltransferase [Alkalimonas delamerensis]|uniref:GNAT family N-acetyltransferase n=1 Tax=Alkalimonas delamerensis TaxID=265981 RepID=A0ABT9GNV6_9GAMM|nr:GNAT family N-acetyltransferase [Alkalimonas delamerensis]MDP4528648.1 GNAT family N-acetyltransferase [Alkalimonas delamerensis]
MSQFNIRVLKPKDWPLYKQIRLASLQESPDAFGLTYQQALLLPDADWASLLNSTSDGALSLPLVVDMNQEMVALAWGLIPANKDVAHIYQMWVAPKARGKGIAIALLDELKAWALAKQCKSLQLSVTTTNSAAVGLYHRYGFQAASKQQALQPDSALVVQSMQLPLNHAA